MSANGEQAAKRSRIDPAADAAAFTDIFPSLVDEIIADVKKRYPDYDEGALEWFRKSMDYNCPGGKMNRGLSVLNTLRHLKADVTPQEEKEARILGWTIEWLQAFFLVSDDLMDHSITRRGQPCWYRVKNVGNIAINDAFLIEAAIYRLLKTHFKGKAYYVELLELMLETTYQTELGQMLDLITAPEDQVDLSKFSIKKYNCIVKYKTAFYSFYLPVAMAMLMAGITDTQAFDNAKAILLKLGEWFQVQDDYLDCYADPKTLGKIGTDIQDNKCGWLVVQALDRVNAEQRKVLEENYGKNDDACVQKVKALYRDLELEKLYVESEKASHAELMKMIDELHGELPTAIFTDFANKIYFRKK